MPAISGTRILRKIMSSSTIAKPTTMERYSGNASLSRFTTSCCTGTRPVMPESTPVAAITSSSLMRSEEISWLVAGSMFAFFEVIASFAAIPSSDAPIS